MSPEGSINTTTVVLTALHTRNAVAEGAYFGRGAHVTRPSPTYTVCPHSYQRFTHVCGGVILSRGAG